MMCPPKAVDQETLFVASRCFSSDSYATAEPGSVYEKEDEEMEDEESSFEKSCDTSLDTQSQSTGLTRSSISVPANLSKIHEQHEIVQLQDSQKRNAYKRVRSSLDEICESICQDLSNIQVLKRQRVKISDLTPALLEESIFQPRVGGGFTQICVDLKKTHPRIAALKQCPI
ncbi:unnamed protein product, partial [Mesorhabditis belari]|uniref:Uncharacterized protein n=1 Tax=Mesorhabditis belari TaxID=2138241 RepID=A0AAF3EZC9_9BILA